MNHFQQTLENPFSIQGIGLHSGAQITLTAHPAPANAGIYFERSDIQDDAGNNVIIPARYDLVVDTTLCTVLANDNGASIRTVEHIMAALCAYSIDNARIVVDGPEVPSLDGSSQFYVREIEQAGIRQLKEPRRVVEVLKPVHIDLQDGRKASLTPVAANDHIQFSGRIDYNHPLIGVQEYTMTLTAENFKNDIADTRSFCLIEDVEKMRQMGLIKGGSLDNAVVIDGDKILNPGGLRREDEFIRHKILDAIGDLYLAGGQVKGNYDGVKCGHGVNNQLLRALFADETAYRWVNA